MMTEVKSKSENMALFFTRLGELTTGERAVLKRNAGRCFDDARGATMAAFYRALPLGISSRQEGIWYAIATMCCIYSADNANKGIAFERAMLKVKNSDSFDTRVRSILDTAWDDNDGILGLKLYRMVKIMRNNNIDIDFASLLKDLIFWNHHDRFVQKKWAKTYFRPMSDDKTTDEEEN